MNRYELGIVDTRNIINSINELFGVDFKDFALTSFKRRVEIFIDNNKLHDADGFVNKLKTDKSFFDKFLFEFAVKGTEMFRDPALWRIIKENFMPAIKGSGTGFKILFAGNEFGEDLYSLLIFLREEGLLDKVRIFATVYNDSISDYIKTGEFDPKLIETNEANYNRANGIKDFSDYYKSEASKTLLDTSLIENVTFLKQNTIFDNYPKGVKFVFFRNQMIYYNQILSDKIMRVIYDSLVPGGHLFLGSKESLENLNRNKDFILVDKSENIYKRKL